MSATLQLMPESYFTSILRLGVLALGMSLASPVVAEEKQGMPDLGQIEQTCLPTSTANLMIWFGQHGYPKLILSGATKDDRYLHTVHGVMGTTAARFDLGTKMENITTGIQNYVRSVGYDCDVEYRGLDDEKSDTKPFTPDWLKENDDPNKGFILVIGWVNYHPSSNTYTSAIGATHAITLVNVEPDMLLVHDPAHYEDETGRKILMTQPLTSGTYAEEGYNMSVAGLMLLKGTLMDAPPNAQIMLLGAVRVTMHPSGDSKTPTTSSAPSGIIAGDASSAPASSNKGASTQNAHSGWISWMLDLILGK